MLFEHFAISKSLGHMVDTVELLRSRETLGQGKGSVSREEG